MPDVNLADPKTWALLTLAGGLSAGGLAFEDGRFSRCDASDPGCAGALNVSVVEELSSLQHDVRIVDCGPHEACLAMETVAERATLLHRAAELALESDVYRNCVTETPGYCNEAATARAVRIAERLLSDRYGTRRTAEKRLSGAEQKMLSSLIRPKWHDPAAEQWRETQRKERWGTFMANLETGVSAGWGDVRAGIGDTVASWEGSIRESCASQPTMLNRWNCRRAADGVWWLSEAGAFGADSVEGIAFIGWNLTKRESLVAAGNGVKKLGVAVASDPGNVASAAGVAMVSAADATGRRLATACTTSVGTCTQAAGTAGYQVYQGIRDLASLPKALRKGFASLMAIGKRGEPTRPDAEDVGIGSGGSFDGGKEPPEGQSRARARPDSAKVEAAWPDPWPAAPPGARIIARQQRVPSQLVTSSGQGEVRRSIVDEKVAEIRSALDGNGTLPEVKMIADPDTPGGFVLVDQNHTFAAYKELGFSEVPGKVYTDDEGLAWLRENIAYPENRIPANEIEVVEQFTGTPLEIFERRQANR